MTDYLRLAVIYSNPQIFQQGKYTIFQFSSSSLERNEERPFRDNKITQRFSFLSHLFVQIRRATVMLFNLKFCQKYEPQNYLIYAVMKKLTHSYGIKLGHFFISLSFVRFYVAMSIRFSPMNRWDRTTNILIISAVIFTSAYFTLPPSRQSTTIVTLT